MRAKMKIADRVEAFLIEEVRLGMKEKFGSFFVDSKSQFC